METLLEYHGFSLRRYEELYMVKEGPFLNSDADFPTMRSRLVDLKKSRRISDDVKSAPAISDGTEKRKVESIREMAYPIKSPSKREGWAKRVDDEMLQLKVETVPKVVSQPQRLLETPIPTTLNIEDDRESADVSLAAWNGESDHEATEASPVASVSLSEDDYVSTQEEHVDKGKIAGFTGIVQETSMNGSSWTNLEESFIDNELPTSSISDLTVGNAVCHSDAEENLENDTSVLASHQEDEAFAEKLRLILRSLIFSSL